MSYDKLLFEGKVARVGGPCQRHGGDFSVTLVKILDKDAKMMMCRLKGRTIGLHHMAHPVVSASPQYQVAQKINNVGMCPGAMW